MNVKKTVSVGTCFVYVEGMKMNCPLCGVIVESGQRHRCGDLIREAEHQRQLRQSIAKEGTIADRLRVQRRGRAYAAFADILRMRPGLLSVTGQMIRRWEDGTKPQRKYHDALDVALRHLEKADV